MGRLGEVARLICDVFGDESINVSPDLNIRELENWDSFRHFNLKIAIEDAFEIVIAPADMEHIYSIRDLLSVIERRDESGG